MGCKERRSRANLIRASKASERHFGGDERLNPRAIRIQLSLPGSTRKQDVAGGNCVHANAELPHLPREIFAVAFERGLRSAVSDRGAEALQSSDGADEDDVAAPRFDH